MRYWFKFEQVATRKINVYEKNLFTDASSAENFPEKLFPEKVSTRKI